MYRFFFITDTCIIKLLSVLLVIFLLSSCKLNEHVYLSDSMHGNSASITQIYWDKLLLHYTSVFLFRPLYNLNHCLQMLVQLLWEYWISSFIPLYKLIRNIQSRNQNSITSALICLLKRKKEGGQEIVNIL